MATRSNDRMISFQEALTAHLRKYQSGDRLAQEAERLGVVDERPARPACEVCCDRGKISYAVPVDDPRFGKLFPCPNPTCPTRQAHLQERQKTLVKYAQIPEHYQGFTFQTWLDAATHRPEKDNWFVGFAHEWIEAPGHWLAMPKEWLGSGNADAVRNGLIFAGGYGLGKTGLMIAMAHELIARNEQPMYIRAMDYFKLKYRTYRRDSTDSDDEAIDLVQTAPILMLDDFNVENKTDNMQDVMEDLVRYRHGHDLPTLITCNQNIRELEELWGRRSMSALLEICHWIPVGGAPLRDTRQLGGSK